MDKIDNELGNLQSYITNYAVLVHIKAALHEIINLKNNVNIWKI